MHRVGRGDDAFGVADTAELDKHLLPPGDG